MALSIICLGLLLLQSAIAATDEAYDALDLFNPEDDTELDSYLDRKVRNDKFLRFGRRFWDYDTSNELPYDDSEVQRPPRTGRQEKNDLFIRFGRSKQDSLRLNGIPQQRTARDKTSFLRFGRSITEENKKKRAKRGTGSTATATDGLKRHESYLRFGRNSNFMRFGRNPGHVSIPSQLMEEAVLKQIVDSGNEHLIGYLRNLLKQSKDNIGHFNEI